MNLYLCLAMCDEIIGMKYMLKACMDSFVPANKIIVCVDNARTEDKESITTLWENHGIKYLETQHKCPYPVNAYYKSTTDAVNLAIKNGATDDDILYISPIDCIPNKGFYDEIKDCSKKVIQKYGYKWQASVGWFFHAARNRPMKYLKQGAKYHGKMCHHKAELKEFGEWYSEKANTYLYKGEIFDSTNEGMILYAPVIQPLKRWNELGGFCGKEFKEAAKTSWDGEYIKRGLKEDGMGVFSFLGAAVFHHDLKGELHKQRGWKK